MAELSGELDFRLLGPFEVLEGGTRLEVRGARARALLAVLLLNAGQPMVVGQLVEALWGGRPPRTAKDSVQFFVHQIRRGLGSDAAGVLRTTTSGYLLQIAPEQVDTERFQRHLAQARTASAGGSLQRAWESYDRALGLWRGQALMDFAGEAFAQPEIARLEELRLTAVEERLRTGIELGRHAELVGEVEALVRAQPLREQARALLMLALYRSGRQAEALAAYQAAQEVLTEQLGIEPGHELRALERAILAQDPALLAPPPGGTVERPTGPQTPAEQGPDAAVLAGSGTHTQRAPVLTERGGPDGDGAARPAAPEPVVQVPQRDERKIVTVLVADVAEADPGGDPEDVRGQTSAALTRITERVRHYGGMVQAEAMGRLLAVFGAARSQEDDPERAVRAGLDVCAEAADGQRVRVGVATGEVVVSRGDQASGEFGEADEPGAPQVVGDVVHAAAALALAAPPGTVRVGAGTYRTTSRSIGYRRVPATDPSQQALEQLTGVQVWEAVQPLGRTGAQVADLPRSPLIERQRETGILDDLLNRFLRDREPQLLTLISDPGLGKSRLAAELANLVDRAETLVTWRVGHSTAYGEGAFRALAEIVKSHTGVLETDPAEVAEDKLRTVVGAALSGPEQVETTLASLRALLGPTTKAGRSQELTPGWHRFFTALAVQRPTVVVFEDLQWADDALLEFVDGLPGQVGPVPLLVVATGRPELLDRRPGWGGGQRNAITLSLTPLSREGTATLLDALLPGRTLPPATREALLSSSGGNPLYVEEYVRMLAERDPATLDGQQAELPVPATVQQLIAARLDALPPEDKRLLQDAAVIGEVGWVGALAAASGRDRTRVQEAVRRLERRELLRRIRVPSVAGETEYAFRHALVRDVAYSQLLRGERSAQHLRVAEWVAALNPDSGDRIELLAHHYQQALQLAQAGGTADPELMERTREVLRAAGDRARQLGALASAEHWYAAALELWPADAPDRPELLFELGRARSWHHSGGADLLAQARDAFVAAGNPVRAAQAALQQATLARNTGNPQRSQAHLEEALALNPGDPAARVVAMAGQVLELNIRGYLIEAIEFGRDIIREADALGMYEEKALALASVGMARMESGDREGESDSKRCVEAFQAASSPTIHHGRWGWAQGLLLYGDLRRCAEVAVEARTLAEAGSVVPGHVVHWLDATMSMVDYGLGRWDAVVDYVNAALAAAGGQRGYPEPWYRPVRGRVRLGRGDLEGAIEDAEQGCEVAELTGEIRMVQPCRALRARALLAAGRRKEAVSDLDEVLSDQHGNPATATVTPDQAVVMFELGYPEDALPDRLWPTRWHQAARKLVARDLEAAVELLELIGAGADTATARLLVARTLAAQGRGDDARAALDQAVAFWKKAGASAYLAEAEALAATLTTPRAIRGDRG